MMMIKTLMTASRDFAQRHWPAIGLAALLVVVLGLAGYAVWPRLTTATAVASNTAVSPGWSRVCVAGVSYLQFASGATVGWTAAGKVKTCGETTKVSNVSK